MPLVDIAIAVIAGSVALRARLAWALASVVATIALVPNTLVLPGSPTSVLTIQRIAVVALLLNLLLRIRRGRLPASIFAITPVHAVFLVFLAVTFILGVVQAQPSVSVTNASHAWSNYLDLAVIFVTGLAAIRATDDLGAVLRIFAVLLLVTAVIAIWEHFTGRSWSTQFFRGTGQAANLPEGLAERGGDVRVRVGSLFSLAYAWWAVAVVPLAIVYFGRLSRRTWLLVPTMALVVLALYWTHARSVAAPLIFALLVIPLLSRNRRLAALGLSLVAVLGAVLITSSSVAANYSKDIDQGSIDVRFERIPPITAYVADHAFGGLGFTGVQSLGFRAVDSSFLLIYGDIGVIGLTMLALLFATVVFTMARGLFTPDTDLRLICAAALLGVLTLIASGFIFDSITQIEDQRMLYLIAAIGVVAAERSVGPPRWLAFPGPSRLVAIAAAVGGGLLLYASAPTHVAATVTFSTLTPYTETVDDPPNAGKILVTSVCNTIAIGKFSQPDVQLTCRDPELGPGQGELRIQAPDRETAGVVLRNFLQTVQTVPRLEAFRISRTTEATEGRPTALRTAPVWLPMIIGVGVILLPPERRRTKDKTAAPPPA